jgi:hypothetical protein
MAIRGDLFKAGVALKSQIALSCLGFLAIVSNAKAKSRNNKRRATP